jgi:hypothetical protein
MKISVALLVALCFAWACAGVDIVREPAGEQRAAVAAPPQQSIAGVVVDADGNPVRARVSVVSVGGSSTTNASADGCFVFLGLADRDYVVCARTEERFVLAEGVRIGQEDLRLVPMRRGAVIEPRLRGRSECRLEVSSGETRVADFTLRSTASPRLLVPPGVVRLRFYGGGLNEERELALREGEVERAVLDVGAGSRR